MHGAGTFLRDQHRTRGDRDLPAAAVAAATQQHPTGASSPRRPGAPPAPPRPAPRRRKKLAATNRRAGRRLTSASRRATLPGRPRRGQRSVPSPGAPGWPRPRSGLYIGRALGRLRVPAVRELPSAPRGAGGARRAGHPGAPCRALRFSSTPPSRPLPPSSSLAYPPQKTNFFGPSRPSPVIRRGSCPAAPAPRAPPHQPACCSAAPTSAGPRKMSTTLLSAFYDIDFLCKTEKSLANLSLNNMLDKKAVGTPVAAAPSSSFTPGFLRRHSASNLHALAHPAPSPGSCSPKFPGSANGGGGAGVGGPASYGALKEPSGGAGTALLNKENKFRDRSFSENGERSQHLLHLQQQQQKGGGSGSQINSTRYKTELCRPFEESGTCKYGEKCQFAHGFHELRSLTRHPKYKTELCRTFHTIGFCPYGPRCHFIHNADERRPAPSGGAAAAGDLRAFAGARDALHLGFPREPRPKLHHSLSFSGFPSGHHHQPPGGLEPSSPPLLLDSPTSRTPPPPSCSSASSSSSSSASSCSVASAPAGAPTCCTSTAAAAAAAAAAALLYGTGGAEDLLLPPGAPCTACAAASPSPSSSSSCANNAFAFGPELSSLITPLAIQTHSFAAAAAAAYYRSQQPPPPQGLAQPPAQPPSPPFGFPLPRRLSESPVFDAPPSPPDSLSDRDSYLSGSLSSGSLSGSESPSLDPGRRLPIFSRLSISDD